MGMSISASSAVSRGSVKEMGVPRSLRVFVVGGAYPARTRIASETAFADPVEAREFIERGATVLSVDGAELESGSGRTTSWRHAG